MAGMKTAMAVAGTVAMLAGFVGDADAASIRVRCETRASRSKISVDGNNLAAGIYTARVRSGANRAVSGGEAAVGDEVEFDFDSNRADVAAGATRIAKNFLDGSVRGELLNARGAVVARQTASCRAR
jgi:hypothetical protein